MEHSLNGALMVICTTNSSQLTVKLSKQDHERELCEYKWKDEAQTYGKDSRNHSIGLLFLNQKIRLLTRELKRSIEPHHLYDQMLQRLTSAIVETIKVPV